MGGKGGGGKGYGGGGGFGKGGGDGGRSAYSGEMLTGTVARFDRGFGYITPDNGDSDVFVHFSAIEAVGFKELHPGERVSFGVEPDPKGKGKGSVRAACVSVI